MKMKKVMALCLTAVVGMGCLADAEAQRVNSDSMQMCRSKGL